MGSIFSALLGALPNLTIKVVLPVALGLFGWWYLDGRGVFGVAQSEIRTFVTIAFCLALAVVLVKSLEIVWGWIARKWDSWQAARKALRLAEEEYVRSALHLRSSVLDRLTTTEWLELGLHLGSNEQRFHEARRDGNPYFKSLVNQKLLLRDPAGPGWYRVADPIWNDRQGIMKRYQDSLDRR